MIAWLIWHAGMSAGGDRAARICHPARPRSDVERGADARQLEREYLVCGGDSRSAVGPHIPRRP